MNLNLLLHQILIVVVCIFYIDNELTYGQAQNNAISIEYIEEWVIGDDASDPLEYSLGQPWDVACDSNSNIFIADRGSMNIKAYNNEGKYLRTIGKRGRGPGEFMSFQTIYINSNNYLIVVDDVNYRISKFTNTGELVEEYTMPKNEQDLFFFNQIAQSNGDHYLAVYKKYGGAGDADEIFHIYSNNFEEKIYSFGSFQKLGYPQGGFSEAMARLVVGSISFINETSFLLAPSLYSGTIYQFEKNNNKDWNLVKEINGHSTKEPAYEDYGRNTDKENAKSIFTPQGKLQGYINVSSEGIFKLKNGKIIHFTFTKIRDGVNKNKWQFGAELFDQKLNYKGYYPLHVFNENIIPFIPTVKTKDNEDNFYMISQKGYPVIQKFSLDIQQE